MHRQNKSTFPNFNSTYSVKSCLMTENKKLVIPRNFSMDKESLYEQLITEKKRSRQLAVEMKKLHAKQHLMEKDLVIHDEQDYKRELKAAYLKIKTREEELYQVLDSAHYKQNAELKKQLNSAREELLKYQIYQKFDANTQNVIEDNIAMIGRIEELERRVSELEKVRSESILLRAKVNQLQSVLKVKDQQLEKMRIRDPLTEMNQRHQTKNEQQLVDEICHKNEEIEHLRTQLQIGRRQQVEDQKMQEQMLGEYKQKISQLENEKAYLKERIDSQNKEMSQMSEKIKLVDRFINQNQGRRKTSFIQDMSSSLHLATQQQIEAENMVRSVQKMDIEDIILELKLSLRNRRVSLQEAEQALIGNNKDAMSIAQLESALQKDPIRAHKCQALARYVIEDYQEKEFEFDPEAKASVAQIRSVFKTLLNNYSLEFDQAIQDQVTRQIAQVYEFFTRKQTQKFTIHHLQDFVQSQDLQWTSRHLDFFQQIYFNQFRHYLIYEVNNLQVLFAGQ